MTISRIKMCLESTFPIHHCQRWLKVWELSSVGKQPWNIDEEIALFWEKLLAFFNFLSFSRT